jgi:hypothetical protein
MRTIAQKRKEFMDYITNILNILDPSGDNAKAFHEEWDGYSDKDFDKEVRTFFDDPHQFLNLQIVEFERDLPMDNIEKCAKFMNIPLYEHVALPHVNGDPQHAVVTPQPVPVGYIHLKRMPQTLLKKNTGSVDIKKRNPKTGQVINEDKNGRNSDVETYALTAMGAKQALKEFMGPRADDMAAKNKMNNDIAKNGYVSLEDLPNDVSNKIALNTLDVYFTMQGLRTNLVSPMRLLPSPKEK